MSPLFLVTCISINIFIKSQTGSMRLTPPGVISHTLYARSHTWNRWPTLPIHGQSKVRNCIYDDVRLLKANAYDSTVFEILRASARFHSTRIFMTLPPQNRNIAVCSTKNFNQKVPSLRGLVEFTTNYLFK